MTLDSTGDIGTANMTKNPSPDESKGQRFLRSNRKFNVGRIRAYGNLTNTESANLYRRQHKNDS